MFSFGFGRSWPCSRAWSPRWRGWKGWRRWRVWPCTTTRSCPSMCRRIWAGWHTSTYLTTWWRAQRRLRSARCLRRSADCLGLVVFFSFFFVSLAFSFAFPCLLLPFGFCITFLFGFLCLEYRIPAATSFGTRPRFEAKLNHVLRPSYYRYLVPGMYYCLPLR